jgi:HEAT repeat protein
MSPSRLGLASAVLVAVALGGSAQADVPRDRLERALAGYENTVSRETLAALGEGWERALLALAADVRASSILRVRAIAALQFVRTRSASTFLRGLIERQSTATTGVAVLELKEALLALAHVDGARALPPLAPLLAHPVPDVREAAVRAIGWIPGERGTAHLRSRLREEKEPFVIEALRNVLGSAR